MLVTQAEFGRLHNVSAVAVGKWKKRGMLAMDGKLVDVDASNEKLKRYRDSNDPRATRGKVMGNASEEPKKQPGNNRTQMTAAEIRAKLAALDWTQTFEWSRAAIDRRVSLAGACVGMEVVQSEVRDDGHWGGYQIRNCIAMEQHGGPCYDAIEAGFGFELEPYEVLERCRQALCDDCHPDDELMELDTSLLPMLARPFGNWEIQTVQGAHHD